jgi:hypothetical protein
LSTSLPTRINIYQNFNLIETVVSMEIRLFEKKDTGAMAGLTIYQGRD